MKRNYKQYHPEPAPGGGSSAGDQGAGGSGAQAAEAAGTENGGAGTEGSPAAGAADGAAAGGTQQPAKEKTFSLADLKNLPDLDEPAKDDKGKGGQQGKGAEGAAGAEAGKGEANAGAAADGKDGKGEESALDIKVSNETELVDTTFVTLAEEMKSLGIVAPAEDSFEAFQQSIVTWKDAEVAKAVESAPKNVLKTELEKLPAEARNFFDYLSVEGNTVEKYLKPLAGFDKYLGMDDESLVLENYKADGATEEQAKEFVEADKIDNKIALNASKIRVTLRGLRGQTEANMVAQAQVAAKKINDDKLNNEIKEREAFTKSLASRKSFMNMPVTDNAKTIIQQRFEAGNYRSRLATDPDLAVEVAMFIEFKDQYLKLKNTETKTEGKIEVLKELHNVGLPGAGSGGAAASVEGNDLQGFDAWEKKLQDEQKQRSQS